MSKDYLRTIACLCDVYLDNACLTKQCLPYTTFLQSHPPPPPLIFCAASLDTRLALFSKRGALGPRMNMPLTSACAKHAYAVSLDRMHFERDFEHHHLVGAVLSARYIACDFQLQRNERDVTLNPRCGRVFLCVSGFCVVFCNWHRQPRL